MNICVTVNSKYQRYLYIMLKSLYENNKAEEITLYVVQRDFTDYDKKMVSQLTEQYGNKVEYIWVDEHKYDDMPIYNGGRSNLSLEIYFRLLIPEYLPQSLDRVLMLDVDIVVNKSLRELYDVDFEGRYLAAAPNMCHNFYVRNEWRDWYGESRTNWKHYNTGILMWNLKKIRDDFPREYLFDMAWKIPIKTATFEEEIFNVVHGERGIKELPAEKWNYISTHADWFEHPNFYKYNSIEELKNNCYIIHYAALNPWQGGAKNESFRLWWEWAKQTPYYLEILEECYWTSEKYVSEMQRKVDKEKKKLVYTDLLMDKHFRKQIIDRLEKQNCYRIMIYGAGRIAKCLDNVLENSKINITCYIDKKNRWDFCGKHTIDIQDIPQFEKETDAIVISNPYYFEEIMSDIGLLTTHRIISLDELLREEEQ